ncbi:serine/threonine-protein kinase Sgk2 [Akanthomyces lecanii RCEF 1005]|uniref:non-specific serine/threonine protein kinase n=1 Tax=Akanthomyces lecanii RCEF 1005 TaxID=1081108 RepID=A0A167XKR2_CORDF|nr:serine/threonine-protein kinase Sgk2 [Akanthomyces lecanii RCEF 1005]
MAGRCASEQQLIRENQIGDGLDSFRSSFKSICDRGSIPPSAESIELLDSEDIRIVSLPFLSTLQGLSVAGLLPSKSGNKTIRNDIQKLISAVVSDDFDFDRIKPLLKAALADTPDDALVWELASSAGAGSTPPPRSIASSIQETPWSQNTSGIINSSELRQSVDSALKSELEHLYTGLPIFHEAFFGDLPDLDAVAEHVFRKCLEGNNPLFKDGWSGWPVLANETDVLAWFDKLIPKLEALAGSRIPPPAIRRTLLAQPRTPLAGSAGKRSIDIGIVNGDIAHKSDSQSSRYRWSHVLVPGELKSNPKADTASAAWIDLARYAREVFAAQATRRFILGFTLCGSRMRVWEFDRLGGIASEPFDINDQHGGRQFVATILAFLRMNEEMLGFDPTIKTCGGQQFIEIERNNETERFIIDEVIQRSRCIAGRATVCWKAHRADAPQIPLVIKDSWQYTDREQEGELLRDATDKGVKNVAQYYHHETVCVRGTEDDILQNVRKGLDATTGTKYQLGRGTLSSSAGASRGSHQIRSAGAGRKRPSSETSANLPPRKRSGSASPVKPRLGVLPNRIHRRIILGDYGKPIYRASSRVALLSALDGCVHGHESLHNAGLLHRDISINNLMMNEDTDNPSRSAFLIDLDLAIREQRTAASGARAKTGTRAFMAIGALLGDHHSFMHDLESFFWVLFWVCIHYNGPNERARVVDRFDRWNYVDVEELAELKAGLVGNQRHFLYRVEESFTPYFEPLIPWVNRLRQLLFPSDKPWEDRQDPELYARVRQLLQNAQKDAKSTDTASQTERYRQGAVDARFDALLPELEDDALRASQGRHQLVSRRNFQSRSGSLRCVSEPLPAAHEKPLDAEAHSETVDVGYSVSPAGQRAHRRHIVVGEFKRCLISPDQWQDGKLLGSQRSFSQEGYAFQYACPQIFCFDGAHLLMLQFRARSVSDIQDANCPVD